MVIHGDLSICASQQHAILPHPLEDVRVVLRKDAAREPLRHFVVDGDGLVQILRQSEQQTR